VVNFGGGVHFGGIHFSGGAHVGGDGQIVRLLVMHCFQAAPLPYHSSDLIQ
jgi:hypothetical protein